MDSESAPATAHHEEPRPGRVVAGFGRRVLVEDAARERHLCLISGRRLRVICGDRVDWCPAVDQGDGLVVALHERDNELARPDRRGRSEAIAANVSQLVVIAAATPLPDPFIVDRYLAAAELMGAAACVAWNKIDLLDAAGSAPRADKDTDTDGAPLESDQNPAGRPAPLDLDEFRLAGYPVCRISAGTGAGLDDLRTLLAGHTSILVGQSGVGKSSLLNALLPDADAETAEISTATGEGRHTTTASVLHHLPGGGELIDSPGVRDYAPAPIPRERVAAGYREIAHLLGRCRFANCMHLREPGCAVKAATEAGTISARRYESYRRLVRLMGTLTARR